MLTGAKEVATVVQSALNQERRKPRIAVCGDIMTDVDLHCTAERLCQEGPWPVFKFEREEKRLGGAGNVAEMLVSFESVVKLLGIVGHREASFDVPSETPILQWGSRFTTKMRYFVDGKLTGPRCDFDLKTKTTLDGVQFFRDQIESFKPDAIIIADHGKGVVTPELMAMVASLDVPVFVDPIQSTPSFGGGYPAAIAAGDHEMPKWARGEVVITKRGPGGLHWCDGPREAELPSACRNVVDPLGAGDQFIAALTYQRCLGMDWPEAIHLANVAAGMQCERRGCVPVTVAEVESRIAETRL